MVAEDQKATLLRSKPSILDKLVEPIKPHHFQAIVDRHDGDVYDKLFRSWDHLLVLTYAQLSGADSVRGLAETARSAARSPSGRAPPMCLTKAISISARGRRSPGPNPPSHPAQIQHGVRGATQTPY